MTLRARLIAAVTALLVLVVGAFGLVAVTSHRRVVMSQIDRRIEEALLQPARLRLDRLVEAGDRLLAEMIIDPEGKAVLAFPSGLEGRPDPLPPIDGLPKPATDRYELLTVPGSADRPPYRLGVRTFREGFRLVVAQPLDDLASASRALRSRLFLFGLVIVTTGAGIVWLVVRRGMRPVDHMIEAATAIADGDLSRRVDAKNPGTELGRLAGALNHMLSNIENAFAAETRANHRLKQFVADASHELRTPLAAIAGYSELHRKGALNEEGATERAMGRIEAESKRMTTLVEDLLTLARLDVDQQPPVRQELDLRLLVEGAVADSLAIDPEHPISIQGPDELIIQADPEQLTQVITNLLANARAHTAAGTPIEVELREESDGVELVVRDRGSGIPAEALPYVFDRFYRADQSRSRKSGGGAGLGLAIVEAIARSHGGKAEAANAPGGGARLSIFLPRTLG